MGKQQRNANGFPEHRFFLRGCVACQPGFVQQSAHALVRMPLLLTPSKTASLAGIPVLEIPDEVVGEEDAPEEDKGRTTDTAAGFGHFRFFS